MADNAHCALCDKTFQTITALRRHDKHLHQKRSPCCPICGKHSRSDYHDTHLSKCTKKHCRRRSKHQKRVKNKCSTRSVVASRAVEWGPVLHLNDSNNSMSFPRDFGLQRGLQRFVPSTIHDIHIDLLRRLSSIWEMDALQSWQSAAALSSKNKEKLSKMFQDLSEHEDCLSELSFTCERRLGMSLLVLAAHHQDLSMARRLVDAGAKVDHFGRINLQDSGFVSLLWGSKGYALHVASSKGDLGMTKMLISEGANLEARVEGKYHGGQTALLLASSNGHEEVVQYLLEKGSCVNAVDEEGKTALHLASEKTSSETGTIQLLLRAGALTNIRNKDGKTALVSAMSALWPEAVEVLLKHGAQVEQQPELLGWLRLDHDRAQTYASITGLLEAAKPVGQ